MKANDIIANLYLKQSIKLCIIKTFNVIGPMFGDDSI